MERKAPILHLKKTHKQMVAGLCAISLHPLGPDTSLISGTQRLDIQNKIARLELAIDIPCFNKNDPLSL